MTEPAVWFPAIRTGTGTDVFTIRLVDGLQKLGLRAEVTWLPARAEYAPWLVAAPDAPSWANIVHINTWLHQRFIPRHLPVVATMHLCVHDAALMPYKSWLQKRYHRHWIYPLEAAVLQRAQGRVAVSRYTADKTREAFAVDNVRVIHNGVAIDADAGLPERSSPHNPFRLLYVGNWSARKAVDLLPPIMEQLGSGFALWYTADKYGADQKIALPANCHALGRLDQKAMQSIYREADALLFPSRLEGLPLAVLEAMSFALPVIAAAASSLPEVVTHEVTGLLCPQDDVTAFVAAARRLRQDRELWCAMAVAAASRIKTGFAESTTVNEYIALYKQLLDR